MALFKRRIIFLINITRSQVLLGAAAGVRGEEVRPPKIPRETPILRRHLTQMHLTMHGRKYSAPEPECLANFQITNFKVNQNDAI